MIEDERRVKTLWETIEECRHHGIQGNEKADLLPKNGLPEYQDHDRRLTETPVRSALEEFVGTNSVLYVNRAFISCLNGGGSADLQKESKDCSICMCLASVWL